MVLSMGSILIRHVPNAVHRKFKVNCRQRKISMEQAIVRLIEREVGAARRGRPPGRTAARTSKAKGKGPVKDPAPTRKGRRAKRRGRKARR